MRRSLPVSCSLLLVISVALACDDPEDPKQDDTADSGLMCEEEEEPASEEGGEEPPVGPASGATCPTENPPTYESFGQSFMQTYCTRCHSSELTGDARMCAPLYHDFDSLQGVLVVADHIDQLAAAGPSATNTEMPEDGTQPTLEERQTLGQWIACELDKM